MRATASILRGAALLFCFTTSFFNLVASPLTWFPGPPLDQPISGTATAVASDKSTLLLGGDAYLYDVEDLNVTNVGWIVQLSYFPATVTPGAVSAGGQIIVYGGNDGTTNVNTTLAYSTTDNQQLLAPMLTARISAMRLTGADMPMPSAAWM